MFRIAGNLCSPGGSGGVLTILLYHRVLAQPDPILHDETDAATFERHMRLLAGEFNVIPLDEACLRLRRGSLPPRAVCISFDDGYADNVSVALPILKRLNLTATFFIASGYLHGGTMFNDALIDAVRRAAPGTHDLSAVGLGHVRLDDAASRRAAIDRLIERLKHLAPELRSRSVDTVSAALRAPPPAGPMMHESDVRRLRAEGMDVGAHTITHPILARLDESDAHTEIAASKAALEAITGAPVRLFAYPNGKPEADYGARDVALVKRAGFRAAFSTVQGTARCASDPLQLPRLRPWDHTGMRLGMRLLATALRDDAASAALA
jgi:peptidoglycan/xylan/chitin deacetylase (PgdA/CDA1 family)